MTDRNLSRRSFSQDWVTFSAEQIPVALLIAYSRFFSSFFPSFYSRIAVTT